MREPCAELRVRYWRRRRRTGAALSAPPRSGLIPVCVQFHRDLLRRFVEARRTFNRRRSFSQNFAMLSCARAAASRISCPIILERDRPIVKPNSFMVRISSGTSLMGNCSRGCRRAAQAANFTRLARIIHEGSGVWD